MGKTSLDPGSGFMENNKYLSAKYTVIELANFSNKAAIQSFRGVVTLHLFTNEIVCFKWLLTNQLSRDCVSRHFLWPILLSCLPMMKIRAIYIYCTVYSIYIQYIWLPAVSLDLLQPFGCCLPSDYGHVQTILQP